MTGKTIRASTHILLHIENIFSPPPGRFWRRGSDLQHLGVGGGAAGCSAAVRAPWSCCGVWWLPSRGRHRPHLAPGTAADAAVGGLWQLHPRVGLDWPISWQLKGGRWQEQRHCGTQFSYRYFKIWFFSPIIMSYRCDTEVKMIFLFMEINPDVTYCCVFATWPSWWASSLRNVWYSDPVRKSLRWPSQ